MRTVFDGVRRANKTLPALYALGTLIPRAGVATWWLRRVQRCSLGSALSRLDFHTLRTSDTVFVLATGASINGYPSSYWTHIREHDSIGINFFLLHEHVPTFFVMENMHETHRRLVTWRKCEIGDYAEVPLIVKTQLTNLSRSRVRTRLEDLSKLPAAVRETIHYSIDYLVPGKNASEVAAAYRLARRLGLFTPKDRFLTLTKQGGSVSYIINLAVRAGYRRIVLCGVDLNHTEYFYDSRREEFQTQGLPVPPNTHVGSVHETNDPSLKQVPMRDVILALNQAVLEPTGIELFVGTRNSALHPDIPEYSWPDMELPITSPKP